MSAILGVAAIVFAIPVHAQGQDAAVEFCGKKFASDVRTVICRSRNPGDLSPLLKLKRLATLQLAGVGLKDLEVLKDHPSLAFVYLFGGGIAEATILGDLSGGGKSPAWHEVEAANLLAPSRLAAGILVTPVAEGHQPFCMGNYPVTATMIVCSPFGVTDLEGIEEFKDLVELSISHGAFDDLAPVRSLRKLERLYILFHNVTDFSPLSEVTSLRRLDLGKSNVTDLSFLKNLVNLEYLRLGRSVTDISALGNLTNLRELDLRGSKVSDLRPIENARYLRKLDLDGTSVSDVLPLAGLKDLQVLLLDRTRVKDISPLSELRGLEELGLSGTPVTDISALLGLGRLDEVDLRETDVPPRQTVALKHRPSRPLVLPETGLASICGSCSAMPMDRSARRRKVEAETYRERLDAARSATTEEINRRLEALIAGYHLHLDFGTGLEIEALFTVAVQRQIPGIRDLLERMVVTMNDYERSFNPMIDRDDGRRSRGLAVTHLREHVLKQTARLRYLERGVPDEGEQARNELEAVKTLTGDCCANPAFHSREYEQSILLGELQHFVKQDFLTALLDDTGKTSGCARKTLLEHYLRPSLEWGRPPEPDAGLLTRIVDKEIKEGKEFLSPRIYRLFSDALPREIADALVPAGTGLKKRESVREYLGFLRSVVFLECIHLEKAKSIASAYLCDKDPSISGYAREIDFRIGLVWEALRHATPVQALPDSGQFAPDMRLRWLGKMAEHQRQVKKACSERQPAASQ
ncbi:MAG: leucine-rich repeat domain-containing protein [Deltaproteobacteria bacterium]|nr:leucine-rich repeat domain-containing protein [Deltaproteobacteria bacterium]